MCPAVIFPKIRTKSPIREESGLLSSDCVTHILIFRIINVQHILQLKRRKRNPSALITYCLPTLYTANQKAYGLAIGLKTLHGKQITLSKDISRFPHACIQHMQNKKKTAHTTRYLY